jgi:hypothetical protein
MPPQPLSSGEWAARAGFFLNFTLLLFFFNSKGALLDLQNAHRFFLEAQD